MGGAIYDEEKTEASQRTEHQRPCTREELKVERVVTSSEVWLRRRERKKEDGKEGGVEKHLERLNTVK